MTHPLQPTESLLTFPCAFPIKIMGRTQDGFAQAIVEVVQRLRAHDDVHRTSYVFLANAIRGHRFGGRLAPLCLGRLGLAASGRPHTKGDDSAERKINNFHRYMNGSTFMKMDPCRGARPNA